MKKKILSWPNLLYLAGVGFVILAFMVLLSFNIIGYSVQEKCQLAQEKYEGDCVESLIAYLEDENNPYRSRNSAIWALGEMGDERALPVLETFYTENIPNRESLDHGLSQYELRKAINLINGFNATAWVWRGWF